MSEKNIREPAVAGTFYPSDKKELTEMISDFLKQTEGVQLKEIPKAVIVPHAGYIYSGPVAAVAYKLLGNKLGNKNCLRILLLGPSHTTYFKGAAISTAKEWKTPLGNVRVENGIKELTDEERKIVFENEGPHREEHCLEVQVPFLQTVLKEFTICPLVMGNVNEKQVAEIIEKHREKFDLIVVSSDLSHYYSYAKANAMDAIANESIPALKIEKFEYAGEACGKSPILTLMNLAKKLGWKGKLLKYQNSGDTLGDKSRVVGYGSYVFY